MAAQPRDVRRAQLRAAQARLADKRTALGLCIKDSSQDRGGAPHGPPVIKADGTTSRLCRACTDRATELTRERRRRKREGGAA